MQLYMLVGFALGEAGACGFGVDVDGDAATVGQVAQVGNRLQISAGLGVGWLLGAGCRSLLLLHAVDEEGRVVDEAFCAGEGRLDANGLPRAEGDETGEIDNRRAT